MMYKFLICTALCVALFPNVGSAQERSYWCAKQPMDAKLCDTFVNVDSRMFQIAEEFFDYPLKGAYPTGNITFIEVINRKPGSVCTVSIKSGGCGYSHVQLRFKSGRGQGCYYGLQIWGRPILRPQYTQVVYAQPPVAYAQQPVAYAQQPVAYAQPQVVYAQQPYAQPPVAYAQPQVAYAQPQVMYVPGQQYVHG